MIQQHCPITKLQIVQKTMKISEDKDTLNQYIDFDSDFSIKIEKAPFNLPLINFQLGE